MKLVYKLLIAIAPVVLIVLLIVVVWTIRKSCKKRQYRKWRRFFNELSLSMFDETYPKDNVRYRKTGLGLAKDCVIVCNAWKHIANPPPFHVEIFDQQAFDDDWFFPNLEFLNRKTLKSLKPQTIACKTKEGLDLLKPLLPKKHVVYTGFTSQDMFDASYTKNYATWLHVAGKSDLKGTVTILKAWSQNPKWPRLRVVYKGGGNEKAISHYKQLPNVTCINDFVPITKLRQWMNESGVHICPSEVEGFGHSMNEGRSCGAVVLFTDGGSMKELFLPYITGIPIKTSMSTTTQGLLHLHKVSVGSIERAVEKTLTMSKEELNAMGHRARNEFLKDKKEFQLRMTKLALQMETSVHLSSFGIPRDYGTMVVSEKLDKDCYVGKIGIVMPTFGRPEILEECLQSLEASDLSNCVFVIVDETATKLKRKTVCQMYKILSRFCCSSPTIKIFKKRHGNMFESLQVGVDLLIQLGVRLFVTLDSDTNVRPKWIKTLLNVHALNHRTPKIITGFNTVQNSHRTLHTAEIYRIKDSIGGINMVFDLPVYLDYVRPNLVDTDWDWNVCKSITKAGGTLVSTKPSVVQHIGMYGLNSSKNSYDKSTDFLEYMSINIDKDEAKSFCEADTEGCSQWDQAGIIKQIFRIIGVTNKYFVEFGARRPNILNSSYFRMHENWKGLLLDGNPKGDAPNCKGLQNGVLELLEKNESDRVILRQEFITKENVNQIFAKYDVPSSFDLLTIDIDRNEWHVMDGLDTDLFSPRVVCLEFSTYFRDNEDCVPKYNPEAVWDGHAITNSSLVALNRLMTAKGYSYIAHASGEHAIFVKSDELPLGTTLPEIPNIVREGWQYHVRESGEKGRYYAEDFECKK